MRRKVEDNKNNKNNRRNKIKTKTTTLQYNEEIVIREAGVPGSTPFYERQEKKPDFHERLSCLS